MLNDFSKFDKPNKPILRPNDSGAKGILFITDLPKNTTEYDIYNLLNSFNLKTLKLVTNVRGRTYAFIYFETVEEGSLLSS